MSNQLSASEIAIATATARTQCLSTNETFVTSMLALFVNKRGFEQHRLLLLTDEAVHRVKFDFGPMRVVHSNAMPLAALLAISKGYLRINDGRSRYGFQLSLRLDAAAAAAEKTDVQPFVFLSVADEIQASSSANMMGRRSRSHTTSLADSFVWIEPGLSGREEPSATDEAAASSSTPAAVVPAAVEPLTDGGDNDDDTNDRYDRYDDDEAAYSSTKYRFAPATDTDRQQTARQRVASPLQPSHKPRTLEDCDVCERQVEKFVRAISALAPAASVVSDALRLSAEKAVLQQQSSLVTRIYNKLNFGRRTRGKTESFIEKPLLTQVRALVDEAAGDEQWLNHQLSYIESIFNADCTYLRKGGAQQGVFYVTQRELLFCVDNTGLAVSDSSMPKSSRSVWQLGSIAGVSIRLLSSGAAELRAAAPAQDADPLVLVLTLNQADAEVWLLFQFQTTPLAQQAIENAREHTLTGAALPAPAPAPTAPTPALTPAAAGAAVDADVAAATTSSAALSSLGSLPALPLGEHLLLDAARQRRLVRYLPAQLRYAQWQLFFKLAQDGTSVTTLLASQPGGPQLIVLEDNKRRRFGAFMSREFARVPSHSFVGDGTCFLFDAAMRVYPWTRRNEYFLLSDRDYFAIGSGHDGHFGLTIDRALENGTSRRCETFGNPALTVDGSVTGTAYVSNAESEFQILDLEVWGFTV
jgi:hypothetical protein